MTSDMGTTTKVDIATPRLATAIKTPFISASSLGRNHCIISGPIAGNMTAKPRPYNTRRARRRGKLSAMKLSKGAEANSQPAAITLLIPSLLTSMLPGMAKPACTMNTRLVRRPTVLRLIPYSSMIKGVIGETAKKLSPNERLRSTARPATTKR